MVTGSDSFLQVMLASKFRSRAAATGSGHAVIKTVAHHHQVRFAKISNPKLRGATEWVAVMARFDGGSGEQNVIVSSKPFRVSNSCDGPVSFNGRMIASLDHHYCNYIGLRVPSQLLTRSCFDSHQLSRRHRLLLLLSNLAQGTKVNPALITAVRADIAQLIDNDVELAAKFLRLGFHDSVGGPDGCVSWCYESVVVETIIRSHVLGSDCVYIG
jgi:hypothetical protein